MVWEGHNPEGRQCRYVAAIVDHVEVCEIGGQGSNKWDHEYDHEGVDAVHQANWCIASIRPASRHMPEKCIACRLFVVFRIRADKHASELFVPASKWCDGQRGAPPDEVLGKGSIDMSEDLLKIDCDHAHRHKFPRFWRHHHVLPNHQCIFQSLPTQNSNMHAHGGTHASTCEERKGTLASAMNERHEVFTAEGLSLLGCEGAA